MNFGTIVGSDVTQEWLLPWWWDHYRRHNDLPVTFFDFGMSESMQEWCKARGPFVRLGMHHFFVVEKEEIPIDHVTKWEKDHGKQFWENRAGWFKKPLACIRTPYQKTIWLDLDCEVRGSLRELFGLCDDRIVIAEEQNGPCGVNSGVIVFQKGSPLIQEWADRSIRETELFPGDQDVLSAILREREIDFVRLPPLYNWSRISGDQERAVVYHWHGQHGKTVIRHQITKSLSGLL